MPTFGDILDIDLSTGESVRRPFDDAAVRLVLGGRGLGALELWRRTSAQTDPLSPSNPLIVAAGLLTGSGAPSAARVQLTARSPLTGLLGSSNVGGGFGFALRSAGLAAVVVRGRAPRFSWLSVGVDGAELHDATDLAGLECTMTHAALADRLGVNHVEALVIGPGGARLLPLACLVSRRGHAAGRTGLGAVLGAKSLKAVVALANGEATPVRTGELARLARGYVKRIVASESFHEFSHFGSTAGVEWGNERGLLATRNYATGRSDGPVGVDSLSLHQFFQQRSGCRHCPVQCKAEVRIMAAGADFVGQRPDFEPLVAWGPKIGVSDPAVVVRLHNRCDDIGLDSISAGSAVAFAMDLFERGIITEDDTDGLELRWGNAAAAGELLERMAGGEGFAGLLAHGVQRAARTIGRGSKRYAYHVKGLELSAFDPRGAWGTALGYAVSSRGADYASVYAHHEFDPPEGVAERLYGVPEADPLSPEGKAALVRRSLVVSAVIDSLGLCKVPVLSLLNRFDLELEAELATAFAGLPLPALELFIAGERIVALERLFNLRSGASTHDDRLPVRFTERDLDSLPSGRGVVELSDLRRELYGLMGWGDDGVPTREMLIELGLEEVLARS